MPFCKIVLKTQKPLSPKHPQELNTSGDHLRKKLINLGLLQREAAEIIGVTASTIFSWEHGVEPELIHIPDTIKFLGYIPFECPPDTLGKLRYFKLINGLSYKRLGKVIGRDPEQVSHRAKQ